MQKEQGTEKPKKIDWKLHQQKVYDCIQKINKEVNKIGRNVGAKLREKLVTIIIADESKKHGLLYINVWLIYHGKSLRTDKNHIVK